MFPKYGPPPPSQSSQPSKFRCDEIHNHNHTTTKKCTFTTAPKRREGVGGSYFGNMLAQLGQHVPKIWASNSFQSSQPSKSTPGFTCRWLQTHQLHPKKVCVF